MKGPLYNRIAAATGIAFVAIGVSIAILAEVKDFERSADFAGGSNEMWGTYVLLGGFASVFFLWFTSIFAARLRQVEEASGTSGRLASAVMGSGTIISAMLVLAVGVHVAAREGATELAGLANAILDGPMLAFPIAAYIGAAGLAVMRSEGVAPSSRWIADMSLLVAPTFLALAGLQIFYRYAWINETGMFLFLAWVLAVSVVGVQRWASIDEGWKPTPHAPMAATARRRAASSTRTARNGRSAAKKRAKRAPASRRR